MVNLIDGRFWKCLEVNDTIEMVSLMESLNLT